MLITSWGANCDEQGRQRAVDSAFLLMALIGRLSENSRYGGVKRRKTPRNLLDAILSCERCASGHVFRSLRERTKELFFRLWKEPPLAKKLIAVRASRATALLAKRNLKRLRLKIETFSALSVREKQVTVVSQSLSNFVTPLFLWH